MTTETQLADLTNAESFTVTNETLHDYRNDTTQDGLATPTTVDRWQKYGKDRLYLNGSNSVEGDFIDLKTGELNADTKSNVTATLERDGDELVVVRDHPGNKKIEITITIE